jgi:hypothetical protein
MRPVCLSIPRYGQPELSIYLAWVCYQLGQHPHIPLAVLDKSAVL